MAGFADLDSYVAGRLEKVLVNDEPITVHPYSPDREKGISKYPCYAFERIAFTVDYARARPCVEIFAEGNEDVTVDLPVEWGSGTATGVKSYTRKPYPIPVHVMYELNSLATSKSQFDSLMLYLLQAFPPGHTALVGQDYALFTLGQPKNMDALEIPLFRAMFVLSAAPFWIDRVEEYDSESIQTVDFEKEIDIDYVLGLTEGP